MLNDKQKQAVELEITLLQDLINAIQARRGKMVTSIMLEEILAGHFEAIRERSDRKLLRSIESYDDGAYGNFLCDFFADSDESCGGCPFATKAAARDDKLPPCKNTVSFMPDRYIADEFPELINDKQVVLDKLTIAKCALKNFREKKDIDVEDVRDVQHRLIDEHMSEAGIDEYFDRLNDLATELQEHLESLVSGELSIENLEVVKDSFIPKNGQDQDDYDMAGALSMIIEDLRAERKERLNR